MSVFSSLLKRKKPNLTPSISMPTQEQLHFTPQLRDFASSRIAGNNLGFGEDYLSKTSNPVIAQREAAFKNKTVPFISNQASSRGLGRSSLVTSQLGEAEQDKNRDIDSMVGQFYHLNELQKKQDQTQALGVAQNMQGQESGMRTNAASASERLANATAAQQNTYQDQDRQLAMQGIQAVGSAIAGVPIGGMGGLGGFGGGASIGPALQQFGLSGITGSLGPQTNILGSLNPGQLGTMGIEELLALLQ